MGIKGAVETLSKVRMQGHGRVCNGLILLDQQFTTPQIGEVIRDLLILDSLCLAIERSVQVDQNAPLESKQSILTSDVIVEEDQSLFDVLKLSDPSLLQSLMQIKNNTNVET